MTFSLKRREVFTDLIMSLRRQTLFYSSVLLLGLIASVLLFVNRQAGRFVNEGIADDLSRGSERIKAVEEERLASLRLTAGLVASFPNLKALLATDVSTVRDFLISYQGQNQRTELLIVLDPSGAVVARTDVSAPDRIPGDQPQWTRPSAVGQSSTGILVLQSGIYHAAAMPAQAGGTVFGYVIAGAHIDDTFARTLREFSQSEIVIADQRILGSTVAAGMLPWGSREQWNAATERTGGQQPINIGDEAYLARAISLGVEGGTRPLVVMLRSHDRALEPYRKIRTGLMLLLLLASAVAIAGSAVLARTLTAPVAKLVEGTRQVAAGNLDFRLDIHRKDEIGVLAESFNTMIGERKRLEEQFRQSQKMEAIGRLAGGIAHDFNNLLTAIMGYAQLTLAGLTPRDPLRSNVEEVVKAGERATALTRQLLAFSRRQLLIPEVLDLNAVVADMEKILNRLINPDILFTTALDPGLGRVKADRGQIEQVIMNLAVNAGDAMPQGGKLTIETANVDLRGRSQLPPGAEQGAYVRLVVRDTGTGMDAETLSHIFEPFFTTKERGKGTGLGLATVYGIVQQSNGFIQVETDLGKGTAFNIHLPRFHQEVEKTGSVASDSEPSDGSETILLVEDERALRELASRMLRARGYTVLEASGGKEALEKSARHAAAIHLMITDIIMPEMKGSQLAEKLAALRPDTRVLFMSGYTELQESGVVDMTGAFLQKPFTAATLARRVREILDAPRPPGRDH